MSTLLKAMPACTRSTAADGLTTPRPVLSIEPAAAWRLVTRRTLAISYFENESSLVKMVGTCLGAKLSGCVEASPLQGRTEVLLQFSYLPHPQTLGINYTSYVIWAITPQGPVRQLNLGRLPLAKDRSAEIGITIPYQTFGLIVTVEPYPLVTYPGPMIVAENLLEPAARGHATQRLIEYRGDPGIFDDGEASQTVPSPEPDYETPPCVLGARRAVEAGRRAGAGQRAQAVLQQAAARLAMLERLWPEYLKDGKLQQIRNMSLEVMRLAETARAMAIEDSETAPATRTAEHPRRVEKAPCWAPGSLASLVRCAASLVQAINRAEHALTKAERMEAGRKIVRLEIERTRLKSRQLGRQLDAAIQRLQPAIPELLEARRETRGLVIRLSEALFESDQETLVANAKESLSRLTGLLLGYSGNYRIEIEAHTDSTSSDAECRRLSQDRAESVRNYLLQAGLPADRIGSAQGLGKTRPLTTNDTPVGRCLNRRLEVVIREAKARSN